MIQISNCLSVDDKSTRGIRKNQDPFTAFRKKFNHFTSNCDSFYDPSSCCTIDEKLIVFVGRCRFRMYFPNKPAKYGNKIVMMRDSKQLYAVFLLPCVGKGHISHADYSIKELVKSICGTNRNITNDRLASVPVISSMLCDHKFTVVGDLRRNK